MLPRLRAFFTLVMGKLDINTPHGIKEILPRWQVLLHQSKDNTGQMAGIDTSEYRSNCGQCYNQSKTNSYQMTGIIARE